MSTSAGESRRRAEIEAKRAKLAELKRAREERTSRLQVGRGEGKSVSEATTPSSRKDLDDFVASLVGGPGNARASSSASARQGGAATPSSPRRSVTGAQGTSEYAGSEAGFPPHSTGTTMVNRADGEEQSHNVIAVPRSNLVDSEAQTDLDDITTKKPEKVYYTKETQTTNVGDSDEEGNDAKVASISQAAEQAIRNKVLQEQEQERLKREEEALKLQEEQLEREIEQGLRELSAEELEAIYGATEFVNFVEQSSKIVERALTDNYDYLKDYTLLEDPSAENQEGRLVKCNRIFWDENLCKGRSITDLDWSVKHPELVVASYSRSNSVSDDQPDGLVLVWNMHLADRPEFIFHAQNDVLSVCFSPFQPNLVIGGTYSGQILVWDTRSRNAPILKTPLSAAGHTHPVYSMRIVGSQNAHNLITASTDGTVCSWVLDMLARPQETVELLNPTHAKTDEVSVSVIGFPDQETTSFWVGTEEGNVYCGTRYDRAGWKAGLNLAEVYKAHAAPVTGLHFHPLHGPIDFSDLFLSSSMDWSSRLWRIKNNPSSSNAVSRNVNTVSTIVTPLASFEEANDYVYDVAWHTAHPSMFGQVDGTGSLDIYDLNVDIERPVVTTIVGTGRALNKVRWDRKDGRRLATGGADGKLYVYDIGTMAVPREEEWLELQKTLSRLSNANSIGLSSEKANSASLSQSGINTTISSAANVSTPTRSAVDFERFNQRLSVR
jgi:dynein intermediate chain, cytosolic